MKPVPQDRRRELLRKTLLPKLRVGSFLPRSRELAPEFGVSYATVTGDLHHVLREAGIAWKKADVPGGRIVVTRMP